jgi:hypothetical protein
MKKQILILVSMIFGIISFLPAQEITFAYDASGNRISREIVFQAPIINQTIDSTQINETPFYEYFKDAIVTLYPNPTAGKLKVEIKAENQNEIKNISVFDQVGRLVYSSPSSENIIYIDLTNESKGNYVLKITLGNIERVWKIVKI